MKPASGRCSSLYTCPLQSDPGAQDLAPFADAPPADPRAFASMCGGGDDDADRGRCPPVRLDTGSGLGCAPGKASPCWPRSQTTECFFGAPPDAPAIWSTRPDLVPLAGGATR
jgi:hypothetical protein